MENRVLVISGPTGIGKTALSVKIAKILNTEIISGDSMQIYRGMDIGTAKITSEEADGIKHHLVDILNPDEEYSVAEFKELTNKIIHDLHKAGKIPMIVGGTGLFIDSIIKNLNFSQSMKDDEFRNEMEALAKEKGNEYVHDMLKMIDPISAQKIHMNNINQRNSKKTKK
ncbi:MAG: tRNA (adenosine(37)-N6)-dimethylallyltransferase MiaA, partial [Clostridiaceae bacterium]